MDFDFGNQTNVEHTSWLSHDEPYDEQSEYDEGSWLGRFLQDKKKDAARVDYSILSVTVMTLCLIMVVEVIKHKVEHASIGRPYFTAVLENMYAELSTLGIVEFCVFLLTKYHTSMNKAKKDVFGDVHFALFYTALINVIQSTILAFVTTRISRRLWVQTEALELDHYVEVREEFERIQAQLGLDPRRSVMTKNAQASGSTSSDADDLNDENNNSNSNNNKKKDILDYGAEYAAASWKGYVSFWLGVFDYIRRPALHHQYNNLLMQVRFHELRVHFIQSYNLPAKFKVSDYLIRCEQGVLIKLVHISIVAWLLLTAAANLLYFLLGLAGYYQESAKLVGVAMAYIFFFTMAIFVVVALLVFKKMKSIFQVIMHRPQLWEIVENDDKRTELTKEQMALFWGGSPKLVISALQFMQFGYAVALAIVLMFWEIMNDGGVQMTWFVVAIATCYPLFTGVAANVIPRYTLCTSLASMVDQNRLHQTVANYYLEEAKRHQKEEMYMEDYENAHGYNVAKKTQHTFVSSSSSSDARKGALSEPSSESSYSDHGELPEDDRLGSLDMPRNGRIRHKAISDGVALMARLGRSRTRSGEEEKQEIEDPVSGAVAETHHVDSYLDRPIIGKRQKSISDGVGALSSMTDGAPRRSLKREKSEIIASLVKVDTAALRETISREDLSNSSGHLTRSKSDPDMIRRTRSKSDPDKIRKMRGEERNKTPSDGVQFMARTLAFINPIKSKELVSKTQVQDSGSDNISDVDDIPDVDQLELDEFHREHSERAMHLHRALKDRLRDYFVSKKYPVFSNIFGTMVAFFLLASRVERFMRTEALVPADFVSFDFNQAVTFWILSCYLIIFAMIDCLVLWSVDRRAPKRKSRVVWLASMMDFVLAVVCLVVFWVAELERCCNSSDYSETDRWLKEYKGEPAPCGCPTFGTRLYRGLGTIEPWTSLIALRVFRFYMAKRVVVRLDRRRGITLSKEEQKAELANEENLDPFNVHDEVKPAKEASNSHVHHGHGDHHNAHDGHDHGDHGHGHGHAHRGTAAELWEATLAQHPDIAKRHGMFSAEVLQLMLGLKVDHDDAHTETTKVGQKVVSVHEPISEVTEKTSLEREESFVLDEKYSSLPVEAQEIIMQGKLGKTVRTDPSGPAPYMFQIAEDSTVDSMVADLEQLPFDAPNARVVRAMRRCDRKLIPILNKWMVVDVVMTRFEIVYFEATSMSSHPGSEATLQAIQGTRGGKGLRLKDIAVGRKVVGHLRLSDITCLAVERYLPLDDPLDEVDGPDEVVNQIEFWKDDVLRFDRHKVWPKIKQDHLAIHTSHGSTLYLRFYSDLEEAESHPERAGQENEADGHINKNNAFQWVQTIGRYCGPNQLQQSLPHFATDSDAELRDYVIVHHDHHRLHQHKLVGFLPAHAEHIKRHETVGDAAVTLMRGSSWRLFSSGRQHQRPVAATLDHTKVVVDKDDHNDDLEASVTSDDNKTKDFKDEKSLQQSAPSF